MVSCTTLGGASKNRIVPDTPDLLEKIIASNSQVKGFVAEVRMTYFKDGQRLRGTGTIACMVPGFLRYELLGPHGGPIEAFSTNGVEFQIAKLAESRFFYGPASPAVLGELLPIAPLNLSPEDWVNLLLGIVDIPKEAGIRYDPGIGHFRLEYEKESLSMEVDVGPDTNKIIRIRASSKGVTLYEVGISEWDKRSGSPIDFKIEVPSSNMQLRLKFREFEIKYPLPEANFHLDPPRGVRPEYISL